MNKIKAVITLIVIAVLVFAMLHHTPTPKQGSFGTSSYVTSQERIESQERR